jgi:hypothetical protein
MGRRSPAVALVLTGVACVLVAALPGCHKDTVTTPTLTAGCSAQPSSGGAPLAVSFTLTVAGAAGPFDVAVSYGDGQSGTNPDQAHTYAGVGTYTAAFTVTTATQSARCSALVTVGPPVSPSPSPSLNQPPVPVYKSTPAASGTSLSGRAPLSVRWNMCASSDPDLDRLWFRYDFDGDGRFDQEGTTGANCRTDHVYTAGTWSSKLCLYDIGPGNERLHTDQCRIYTLTVAP